MAMIARTGGRGRHHHCPVWVDWSFLPKPGTADVYLVEPAELEEKAGKNATRCVKDHESTIRLQY